MNAMVGKAVKEAIVLSGRDSREVARMCDLSDQALRKRLKGETPFMADELVRIARLLDVSMRDLLACLPSVEQVDQ